MADLCSLPAFLPIGRKPDPTNISCQPLLSVDEYQIYEREGLQICLLIFILRCFYNLKRSKSFFSEQVRLEKEKLLKESATKSNAEKEYSVWKMSSDGDDKVTESEKDSVENEMLKKIELALKKTLYEGRSGGYQ